MLLPARAVVALAVWSLFEGSCELCNGAILLTTSYFAGGERSSAVLSSMA